jgi:hypothetical protein
MFLAAAIAIFLCVFASTTPTASSQTSGSYVQRKVSSGKFPIHSACMMPPQGILTKLKVGRFNTITTIEMPQESEAWIKSIENMVESHLKVDGISIQSATNPLSSGASEAEISEVISQVRLKLETVSVLMNKKPREIAKSAYTLGDQVGMLPCSENSDIMVFVQSNGKIPAGMAGFSEFANLYVTMADAKTGEILGLIRLYPDGNNFLLSSEIYFGAALDAELVSMNIGSARKNDKASGH